MGILTFIKKICVQTAVYWGNPVNNGSGGFTFDTPREIKCRWSDKTRVVYSNLGNEIIAKTEVIVIEDLDFQGWLYLGYLQDLEDPDNNYALPTNPIEVEGAFPIIAVDEEPLIKSKTEFVRTIFLGFKNV